MLAGSVQVSTGTKTSLSFQDGPVFTRVDRREGPAAPRGSDAGSSRENSYTPSPGASTYGRLGRLDQRDFERQTGAASCLLRILAAIIYWQIREIDRVLSEAGSDADDLNFELLSHISPIGWDNVLLYGEYQLNRSLVRSERLSV